MMAWPGLAAHAVDASVAIVVGQLDHLVLEDLVHERDHLARVLDQLGELRRERDAYLAFEDEINNAPRRHFRTRGKSSSNSSNSRGEADEESRGAEEDTQAIRSEIERLAHVADETRRELSRAEEERRKVDAELSQLDEEERKLEEEERAFWLSYSDLTLQMNSVATQRASLETTLEHDMALLKRLQRTNVYKDAFCIGHEAGFATINGLRLGRLPSPARNLSSGPRSMRLGARQPCA
ncbi:hypothetical protein L7F22_044544 [Adiantum nelumboides]|nr:hypothetical protein [Adiantum nelumboides]